MDELEALDHLDSLINYEVVPRAGVVEGLSLDPMLAFMGALGDPQSAYPVIHVTGTNGKGSTARMIERILTVMGLRVGLYTSPHLHDITERIRVGGEPIGGDDFGQAIGDVVRVEEVQGLGPRTWFDTVTSAALWHFANEAVDVAVVEVGMLGRYDSTNVVRADVAVITNVTLDHATPEQGWRARVAGEKAGIVEPGRPVVVGGSDDELLSIVESESPGAIIALGRALTVDENALAVGGRLISVRTPRASHDDLFVGLHGEHQGTNAALAIAATEEFFDAPVGGEVLTEALATVEVPGRLQVVHRRPTVIVDAAHNVGGAEALTRAVREEFGGRSRRTLVVGMQDGRDPVPVFAALDAASYDSVVVCTTPTPRGVAAAELARAAETVGARPEVVADVEAALDHAVGMTADDDELVVVAGSTIVVAAALRLADEW